MFEITYGGIEKAEAELNSKKLFKATIALYYKKQTKQKVKELKAGQLHYAGQAHY